MADVSERWIAIGVATAVVIVVAILGGLLTDVGRWYEGLRFPSWRPPNWLFGPAWTIIFAFIAASAVIAWERAPDRRTRTILLALFAINAVFNVAWSALFFRMRRPDWALVDNAALWLSIAALVGFIATWSPAAAWIMSPYLAWVTFAMLLNWRMVQLNAPFGAKR